MIWLEVAKTRRDLAINSLDLALIFGDKLATLFIMSEIYMEFKIVDVEVRGEKKKAIRYKEKGKYRRKYCNDLEAAKKWIRKYIAANKEGKADLITKFTLPQLDDINEAFNILPAGHTLSECVRLFTKKFAYNARLGSCLEEFVALKENADLSEVHKRHIKSRMKLLGQFADFGDISAANLLEAINSQKLATKTKLHYISLFREFFDWAKTRGYIKETPFAYIHDSDIPRLKRKNPKFPSIEETKGFFANAEKLYPQFVGILALTAFGGFRAEEAAKLVPEEFDFKHKRIKLPLEKSKSGKNYEQIKVPANLWSWLKKYPPNDEWKKYNHNIYTKLNRTAKLPHNALRHAFATYHMSLYRRADKTQDLMRHEDSSKKLWQTYLAGFVPEDMAKAYFDISPIL